MSKLFWFAILVAMAALLACTSAEPTAEPTATSVPAPTLAPTATPEPTATPRPTAAMTPTPDAGQASSAMVIELLNVADPSAFLSGISETELNCVARRIEPTRLQTVITTPDRATDAETAGFVQCLWDETLLRVFLGELLSDVGTLSPESSACIRAGTSGIDIRSMMLPSGAGGSAEEAMMGSMASFVIAISCLNSQEIAKAAPNLDMSPEDLIGMQCVLDELGGPEGLEILGQQEDAIEPAFMLAALRCGAVPSLGSMMVPSSSGQTPQQSGLGPLTALPVDDRVAMAAELSDAESACVAGVADLDWLLFVLGAPEVASSEDRRELLDCMEDDTVIRLFLTEVVAATGPLSQETSTCIRGGMENIDLRSLLAADANEEEQTAMISGMSAQLAAFSCLNDAEWQAASTAMGMAPGERENMQCVMRELGGPEGMATALQAEDGSGALTLMVAAFGCGLQMQTGGGPSG